MIEPYRIWKDFWLWLNSLATQTVVLVCVGGSVIGCLVFANIMLHEMYERADTAPVTAELSALRTEFARNDSIIVREIRTVIDRVNGVDTKVTKVILIVASESNNELIRSLVPYIEKAATKEDLYNFLLDIQKDVRRTDTARYKIGVRKKPKE